MRGAPVGDVHGPFIKAPVWTWEVPVYFWVGGMASGSAFVAMACDAAGDRRSAAIARRVALAIVMPAPALLILDLGRPGRFLNMLRIFKPRSPMSMGAWCLVSFSATAAGGVGADLLGRRRLASGLGASSALLGGYLGSYTGVLLASTAVPVWARSRLFLGPIFVCTATATGAAATRLALVARGLPRDHPTRSALGTLETAAIAAELVLSTINERRLGDLTRPLRTGTSGRLFRVAEASVLAGLAAQVAARRSRRWLEHVASGLFLGGGLAFRFAWVQAGRASALDHAAAAALGRGRTHLEDETEIGGDPRMPSSDRRPAARLPGRRVWAEAVRRVSLVVERRLPR
jgi:formate-dependent nitrite reductase membrane component NrfD